MTVHFVNLLEELRHRSLRMARLVEDMVREACESAFSVDDTLARRVQANDEDVDASEVDIESEVIRLLALYQPVGVDLRTLCTVLKCNSDLERIADCAVNISERAIHLDKAWLMAQGSEIRELGAGVQQHLRLTLEVYSKSDAELARQVLVDEEAIDDLYARIVRGVIVAASQESERMASFLDMLSIAKNLERIADHATNIAEDVIYLSTGQIVRHLIGVRLRQ